MSFSGSDSQAYFLKLHQKITDLCWETEVYLLNYRGETSDFVRLNRAKVRQAGRVDLHRITIDLIARDRHVIGGLDLQGHLEDDLPQVEALLAVLRDRIGISDEDPFLLYQTKVTNSNQEFSAETPPSASMLDAIEIQAKGLDLAGILAHGDSYRGFSNSFGQINWFQSRTFNFDWSCHLSGDKAVKCNYAGHVWDDTVLSEKFQQARVELEVMGKPPRSIEPGQYRTYLAPRALADILQLTTWGGFSCRQLRTRHSPLLRLYETKRTLSDQINLREDHGEIRTPAFSSFGFLKDPLVELVRQGKMVGQLTDARSAREYDVVANDSEETPEALVLSGGTVSQADVLPMLGTGLYINDLWYLNFSDINECRITGMTRFACFWVEDAKITSPVNVMRFDDSLYAMLGSNLTGLTDTPELMLDTSSYGFRATGGFIVPGAVLESLNLTL